MSEQHEHILEAATLDSDEALIPQSDWFDAQRDAAETA